MLLLRHISLVVTVTCAAGCPRVPSSGCEAKGSGAYGAGTTVGELAHDGLIRTFRVHVPPGYDGASPLPLVLMFHGGGGSAMNFEASTGMDSIADSEGFIVVYPDGTGNVPTWNSGGCCGFAVQNNIDDVGFVDALLDHLEAELCIDRRRVFASGMSNGGMLTHRLACELSNRIAAIAPVAGPDMTSTCTPSRPVSVLHTHGTQDARVPWDGGEGCGFAAVSFTSVPTTIERWQDRNGCDATTTTYLEQGDGTCEALSGCAIGVDVVLCAIEGGGHSWPGGEPPPGLMTCPADGIQSSTFFASEVVWSFFAGHPMLTPPT